MTADDEPVRDVVAEAESMMAEEAARRRAIAGPSRPRRATNVDAKGSYSQAALRREREAVAQAIKGQRESTVNTALLALGRHVAAGHLSENEVRREIESACYVNRFIQDDYGGSAERFWTLKGDRSLRHGMNQARDYTRVGTGAAPEANVIEVEDFSAEGRKLRRRRRERPTEEASPITVTMVPMTSVKSELAQWIWSVNDTGYMALKEITVFAGKGSVGKSTAARWVVARITRGELPGCWEGHPMNVAVQFYEETNDTGVKPGLLAAHADLTRVFFPQIQILDSPGQLSLIRDQAAIVNSLLDNDIRVLVFDPVMNLIAEGGADSNKNHEVRPIMAALKGIAEAINGVVLLVAHLNKGNNRDVSESITGAGSFNQYPRSVIGFMEKEPGDTERVMEQRKNNLGKMIGPMTYKLDVVPVVLDSGECDERTVFNIVGPSRVSLSDIVDGNIEGDDGATRIMEATRWLESFLRVEQPVPAKVVFAAAHEADAFSQSTIKRAKKKLKVVSRQRPDGDLNKWYWGLPEYWDATT